MKRTGKKTLAWESTRRKLVRAFANAGIIRCELCGTDFGLGFAHSLPRRCIVTKEQMEEVALLCTEHHRAADSQGHAHQLGTIRTIIARREIPVQPLS